MKNSKRYKLSIFQGTAIVSATIIGVTVLNLPRLATEKSYASGFITTFFGGVISIFFVFIIYLFCKRFPNQIIFDFLPSVIGKVPGFLYGMHMTIYFTIIAGGTLRAFSDALKITLLPNTPLEFITVVMFFTLFYFVVNGITTIAKISELFLPLIVITLSLVILLNVPDVDATNLRPVLSSSSFSYFKGLFKLIISFLGYESMFFIMPYMRRPNKGVISGIVGVLIPTIIYVSIVATAIGIFGAYVTKSLTYPTLTLAKRINFPGGFLERFDIFIIIFWILAAFTTIGIYYYMASVSLTRVLKLRNYKPFMLVLVPWIYLVSILPQNVFQIDLVLFIAGMGGLLGIILLIVFYLIALIRKKGDYS